MGVSTLESAVLLSRISVGQSKDDAAEAEDNENYSPGNGTRSLTVPPLSEESTSRVFRVLSERDVSDDASDADHSDTENLEGGGEGRNSQARPVLHSDEENDEESEEGEADVVLGSAARLEVEGVDGDEIFCDADRELTLAGVLSAAGVMPPSPLNKPMVIHLTSSSSDSSLPSTAPAAATGKAEALPATSESKQRTIPPAVEPPAVGTSRVPPASTPRRRRAVVDDDNDGDDEGAMPAAVAAATPMATGGVASVATPPWSARRIVLSDSEDEGGADEEVPLAVKPRKERRRHLPAEAEVVDLRSTDGSDDGSDLDDFIVPDDEEEEGGSDEEDGEMSPPRTTPRKAAAAKSATTPASKTKASRTPSRAAAQREFLALAQTVYDEYNDRVFNSRLPADLPIRFNARMTSTAGYCKFLGGPHNWGSSGGWWGGAGGASGGERHAAIQLSSQLVTSEARLRSTLAHEMCHAGQWVIDNEARPPHGKAFKRWTKVFMRRVPRLDGFDGLKSIYHSYGSIYRVRYGCTSCGWSRAYANQSSMITSAGCRACGGPLKLLGKTHPDGTLVAAGESEAFVIYVRKHYAALKGSAHGESDAKVLMAELGRRFREEEARKEEEARGRIDWAAVIAEEAYGEGSIDEVEALFAPLRLGAAAEASLGGE